LAPVEKKKKKKRKKPQFLEIGQTQKKGKNLLFDSGKGPLSSRKRRGGGGMARDKKKRSAKKFVPS